MEACFKMAPTRYGRSETHAARYHRTGGQSTGAAIFAAFPGWYATLSAAFDVAVSAASTMADRGGASGRRDLARLPWRGGGVQPFGLDSVSTLSRRAPTPCWASEKIAFSLPSFSHVHAIPIRRTWRD